MRLARTIVSAVWLVLTLAVAWALCGDRAQAQGLPTTLYDVPPRWLIDAPTAGTLPRANFSIGTRLYPNGGAIAWTSIGLSNRLMLGISYGGENIIANSGPNWNPSIEFNAKFRLIDEVSYFPAVTFGFNSQGFGAFNEAYDRYTFKSKGFFAVVSRSFYFYQWTAGWHFGVNYSLENDFDKDEDISLWAGLDATFRYNLALVFEYDAGLNDDRSTLPNSEPNRFGGKGRGYLNVGLRWLFSENLEIEFFLKDLLVNRRESNTLTREIRLTYLDHF